MKLFPSHSTKDKELLRANSIDPWLCEKDIEYWVAKIEVALKESDLVRNSAMPGTAASRPRVTVLILCTRAATLPHRSTTTIASLWRGGSRWSSGSVAWAVDVHFLDQVQRLRSWRPPSLLPAALPGRTGRGSLTLHSPQVSNRVFSGSLDSAGEGQCGLE
jgi:hypothetical protein